MAATLHRPAIFPVPAFALKLALGEMSEMVLASQRVLPTVAKSSGFRFQYPELQAALDNLLAAST
jgi:NAD dependent epimerase/dehydratase family enzyme